MAKWHVDKVASRGCDEAAQAAAVRLMVDLERMILREEEAQSERQKKKEEEYWDVNTKFIQADHRDKM